MSTAVLPVVVTPTSPHSGIKRKISSARLSGSPERPTVRVSYTARTAQPATPAVNGHAQTSDAAAASHDNDQPDQSSAPSVAPTTALSRSSLQPVTLPTAASAQPAVKLEASPLSLNEQINQWAAEARDGVKLEQVDDDDEAEMSTSPVPAVPHTDSAEQSNSKPNTQKSYKLLMYDCLRSSGPVTHDQIMEYVERHRRVFAMSAAADALRRLIELNFVDHHESQTSDTRMYNLTDTGRHALLALESSQPPPQQPKYKQSAAERQMNEQRARIAKMNAELQQQNDSDDEQPIMKRYGDDLPVSAMHRVKHTSNTAPATTPNHTTSSSSSSVIVDAPLPKQSKQAWQPRKPKQAHTATPVTSSSTSAVIIDGTSTHSASSSSHSGLSSTDSSRAVYDSISDELCCCICMDWMVDAVALPCSHTFCNVCITSWRLETAKQQSTSITQLACPQCRAEYVGEPMRISTINNIINKLTYNLSPGELTEFNKRVKANHTKQGKLDKRVTAARKKHDRHQHHDDNTMQSSGDAAPLYDPVSQMNDFSDNVAAYLQHLYSIGGAQGIIARFFPGVSHQQPINNVDEPIEIDNSSSSEDSTAGISYSVNVASSASQCYECIKTNRSIPRGTLRVVARLAHRRNHRHTWHAECFATTSAVVVYGVTIRQLDGYDQLQPDNKAVLQAVFND